MNNLLIMVLYPYWWAICCMFQNHWVNSLFTEMTIWGPWCPRRVSQTVITHAWDKCFCHGSFCMCISVLKLVSLILFLACGTVKVKRPCLFIHFYICIGIIFLLFYSCWQAITHMLPNQYANASVTITALLGLWCRRRVPQTGMIFYPCLRCVLLASESLMCISS